MRRPTTPWGWFLFVALVYAAAVWSFVAYRAPNGDMDGYIVLNVMQSLLLLGLGAIGLRGERKRA